MVKVIWQTGVAGLPIGIARICVWGPGVSIANANAALVSTAYVTPIFLFELA